MLQFRLPGRSLQLAGCPIGSARPTQAAGADEELVQDLLTIVTVFAGRLYGHRAKGVRAGVRAAPKEVEEGPDGKISGTDHEVRA